MEQKIKTIIELLGKEHPNAKSELVFSSTYQLLVAVILSAQCTDRRVNEVTKQLFEIAPTAEKMVQLSQIDLEKLIFSCGFYKNKAKHVLSCSRDIIERFYGQVPNTVEKLKTLAGVGQKTANVVYAVGFGGQAIAVDTHVFRVSNRIGITDAKNVSETEKQLKNAIDEDLWSDCHHYILLHGRYVCKSQKPNCGECSVKDYCKYYSERK